MICKRLICEFMGSPTPISLRMSHPLDFLMDASNSFRSLAHRRLTFVDRPRRPRTDPRNTQSELSRFSATLYGFAGPNTCVDPWQNRDRVRPGRFGTGTTK
jgi:hypothetical protein